MSDHIYISGNQCIRPLCILVSWEISERYYMVAEDSICWNSASPQAKQLLPPYPYYLLPLVSSSWVMAPIQSHNTCRTCRKLRWLLIKLARYRERAIYNSSKLQYHITHKHMGGQHARLIDRSSPRTCMLLCKVSRTSIGACVVDHIVHMPRHAMQSYRWKKKTRTPVYVTVIMWILSSRSSANQSGFFSQSC